MSPQNPSCHTPQDQSCTYLRIYRGIAFAGLSTLHQNTSNGSLLFLPPKVVGKRVSEFALRNYETSRGPSCWGKHEMRRWRQLNYYDAQIILRNMIFMQNETGSSWWMRKWNLKADGWNLFPSLPNKSTHFLLELCSRRCLYRSTCYPPCSRQAFTHLVLLASFLSTLLTDCMRGSPPRMQSEEVEKVYSLSSHTSTTRANKVSHAMNVLRL